MKNSSNDKLVNKLNYHNANQAKKLTDGKVYILKDLVKSKYTMAKKGVIEDEVVLEETSDVEEFDEGAFDGLDSTSD